MSVVIAIATTTEGRRVRVRNGFSQVFPKVKVMIEF